jgi:hypothetical protein
MAESLVVAGIIELLGTPAGFVPSALPGCTGATYGLGGAGDTWDLGAPQPVIDVLATLLADGEVPLGRRASNRTMSLPVVIRAPDLPTLAAARETLFAAVNQPYWTLVWTGPPGNPFTFDCFRAHPSVITYSLEDQDAYLSRVQLAFEALPYGRSAAVQTLNFTSPAQGGTPPPSPVTLDTFASVSSSTQGGWWSASTNQGVIGSTSAYWDWDGTDGDSAPWYTHTITAKDITGRTVMSFWVGLASPQNYSRWHKGKVTFALTLSDSGGHQITFGASIYCYASNSTHSPVWNQITAAIPQGRPGFDYTHVTGYSIHGWRFTDNDGDLELDCDTYLNGLTATPATAGTPATSRGTVYQLLGVEGSAHTPIAVTAQQAGTASVNSGPFPFEGSIGNWVPGANNTVAYSTAAAHTGTGSLIYTATSAATGYAISCAAGSYATQMVPCTAGQILQASVWALAVTTGRVIQPGVDFYTSAGVFISGGHTGSTADVTTGWTLLSSSYTAPATAAWVRLSILVSSPANGEVHYLDDAQLSVPFKTFIAHMPSPDAPAALVPLVQAGNGTDPPDGREYVIPAPVPGVNADFAGTYTVILTNFSWSTPGSASTVTVTVKQYDYPGGPSSSVTVTRTVTPNTDVTNGIVIIDNVTLPIRATPPDNSISYYTVAVTSTVAADRFLDVLFIDTEGQLIVVNVGDSNSYSTYWIDPPTATEDLGLLTGSVFDRSAAVSVANYAIMSGGPLTAEPGDNSLLVYAIEGQPGVSVTYIPRYWADDPGS